jgi:hypothetical protein
MSNFIACGRDPIHSNRKTAEGGCPHMSLLDYPVTRD